jgi:hypothetical protein
VCGACFTTYSHYTTDSHTQKNLWEFRQFVRPPTSCFQPPARQSWRTLPAGQSCLAAGQRWSACAQRSHGRKGHSGSGSCHNITELRRTATVGSSLQTGETERLTVGGRLDRFTSGLGSQVGKQAQVIRQVPGGQEVAPHVLPRCRPHVRCLFRML